MRTPIIAGNWKLNMGPAAAASLAGYLEDALGTVTAAEIVIFPPALSLFRVVDALANSRIAVGVQEVAAEASGAVTGANAAVMARELGCRWMLTGHSERRQRFGETDEGVRDKIRAGLAAGLAPMVCLGETLEERNAGRVETVVHRQLAVALGDLAPDRVATVTLAYEPVWAIGTGVTASPEQAQEVHATLRAFLATRYSPELAAGVRILYGGSVKPDNARALLCRPDIDGALVGGASLQPGAFADIVAAVG